MRAACYCKIRAHFLLFVGGLIKLLW